MILCQKPSSFPLSPSLHHRRHPSAPSAVVVHPTCTPGLLSLSKPTRPSPNRHQPRPQLQQRQSRTSRIKPAAHPRNRSQAAITVLLPDSVNSAAEQALKKSAPPPAATPVSSPDRNTRGRTQVKPPKDKSNRRSASQSSLNGQVRRTNNRQPSPPGQQPSSQAEGPISLRPTHSHSQSLSLLRNNSKHNANLFDPFIVSSSSDTDSASDSAPSKASVIQQTAPKPFLPSYNSTSLRQAFPDSPTPPSRTIPVPRSSHKVFENISRSDPVSSHMLRRKRSMVVEWDSFPVCDDMTIDDVPSTPIRTWRPHAATDDEYQSTLDSPPRTAPLSSTSGFPIYGLPSPPQSPSRSRRHHRSPSDGVFNMSLDEDLMSRNSDDLGSLFGALSTKRSPVSSVRVNKAGYFASSMFQNSPSPDELPPPSFGQLA